MFHTPNLRYLKTLLIFKVASILKGALDNQSAWITKERAHTPTTAAK
jgi:hypothetical protein